MKTIREILGLDFLSWSFNSGDEEKNREKYDANASGKRIEEVIIDGVKITGYNAFSFVRKLTYVKSPTRSADGTIGNLDSYPVFTTPQLQIDFSLLGIDMYRKIMNLIYARREHLVQCYDIVRDTRVTEKMYFEPEELPKLATITRQLQGEPNARIEILGVQDYVVAMVGTNMPNEIININYYDNDDNIIASVQEVENTEILVGEGVTVDAVSGKIFDNKWRRGYLENGSWTYYPTPYQNTQAYNMVLTTTVEKNSKTISFKAVYKSSVEHTLTLNYGLGEPKKDQFDNPLTVYTFTEGKTYSNVLGNFYDSPNPQIEIDGVKYDTYKRKGWFRTASLGEGSTALKIDEEIKPYTDTTIYQLFEPVYNKVSVVANKGSFNFSNLGLNRIAYGSTVAIPNLPNVTENNIEYKFDGWHTDQELTKKFNGTMPPHNITLYGKWEKVK